MLPVNKAAAPALMSYLIPLKLNFNDAHTEAARVDLCLGVFCGVGMLCVQLLHSHLPLEAERLLHVVVATAKVDEADVGAHRHVCLVLLLERQSALQVLVG